MVKLVSVKLVLIDNELIRACLKELTNQVQKDYVSEELSIVFDTHVYGIY